VADGETVALKDGRRARLRPGTAGDGAALKAVHRASILGLGGNAYTRDELESWAAGLKPERYGEAMEKGETFLLACAADGTLAGFASHKKDEVVGFYVHPDWARSGLGRLLLERAEAAILGAGHRTIRIESSMSGLPFYLAQGYCEVSRRSTDSRGGLVLEVADLEKSFSS
jgi:putative acetyltransferase